MLTVFTELFHRPNFLIFDEPTNHLDVESVDALGKALNKFPVIAFILVVIAGPSPFRQQYINLPCNVKIHV